MPVYKGTKRKNKYDTVPPNKGGLSIFPDSSWLIKEALKLWGIRAPYTTSPHPTSTIFTAQIEETQFADWCSLCGRRKFNNILKGIKRQIFLAGNVWFFFFLFKSLVRETREKGGLLHPHLSTQQAAFYKWLLLNLIHTDKPSLTLHFQRSGWAAVRAKRWCHDRCDSDSIFTSEPSSLAILHRPSKMAATQEPSMFWGQSVPCRAHRENVLCSLGSCPAMTLISCSHVYLHGIINTTQFYLTALHDTSWFILLVQLAAPCPRAS